MRVRSTILAAFALTAVAHAQPAAPPESAAPADIARVYACADLTESAARLVCFDDAVAAMRKGQDEGRFAAVDAAQIARIERDSFGLSLPSLPPILRPAQAEDAPQREAAMRMVIARIGAFGDRPVFFMENGQVWTAIESTRNRRAKEGAAVTIRRAALGSYLMSVEGGGAALRVRRSE